MTAEPPYSAVEAAEKVSAWSNEGPFRVTVGKDALTFYPRGVDRLEAIKLLIEGAERSLKLFFYIFSNDNTGQQVRTWLVAAAARGVDVCLMVDDFGADVPEGFFDPLRAAGGRFTRFEPRWSRRYLIRNHQKMLIADDRQVMSGGFNVEDDYFVSSQENGWHDLGFVVSGPIVERFVAWFDELADWAARPNAQTRVLTRKVKRWDAGEGRTRLLIGGPTRGLSSWARCVSRDCRQGRRLTMLMAYFSPSTSLVRRIGRMTKRGPVELFFAGKSDNGATIGATRSFYDYFLRRGVAVWEFQPCKLHAKAIVIDDVTYIGSANFDMRSLYVNLEVVLRIEDAALADRMRAWIETHRAGSDHITPAEHKRQATLWNRIRWNLSWFLVAVVDYNVSRRLNLGL